MTAPPDRDRKMQPKISPMSQVHPSAFIGQDVTIGPFCVVGPDVVIGDGTQLESHCSILGHTVVGSGNRFGHGCAIGGEPQDVQYSGAPTRLIMGNNNYCREGVTIHRGAEKEDHTTRIGSLNLLMVHAHVGHNCHVHDHTTLVNDVLLGGHVHVHDHAIVSGGTAVHQFCSIGTMAFVGGQSTVRQDVPPCMFGDGGNDDFRIVKINDVGMRRSGSSEETIQLMKRAHRMLFRKREKLIDVRTSIEQELNGPLPYELRNLFEFIERQQSGKAGRYRESFRNWNEPPTEQLRPAKAA